MKTYTLSILCAMLAIATLAQAPQSFTFQAVMRDNNNQLILNSPVGMRTTILQGSPNGTVVYQEAYNPNPQTNSNGLITLEIGNGIPQPGYNFATIDWANGPYFIKTEADPNGGTNYTITGTSQLLSVPYALHAKSVTWGDITGKPSKFPPKGHFHSATEITSGTLDVARGGTGATTFTSGNVLIGSGTGAITTLSRSGIDTRSTFPPSPHTHGNITNTGAIGTAAGRIITTGNGGALQATAGTAPGQMLYWNGSAWVNVEPGKEGYLLRFNNLKPTWTIYHNGYIYEEVTNPATGKTWLDRNLGATRVATSSSDEASYGDLYQWGRCTDGHEIRTSGTTTTLSNVNKPGHGYFITSSSSPYDWRSPQNNNLWQGINGINNPCPSGFRLPTETELNAERQSWSSNNSAGAFASPLKLPMAGYRSYGSGSLYDAGSGGDYWSSTVYGILARSLYFYSSNASMNIIYRANGFSVRCIKD
ncbi:MAG: hypothetical protein WBJ84_00065 [Bacteroidales bacterium]